MKSNLFKTLCIACCFFSMIINPFFLVANGDRPIASFNAEEPEQNNTIFNSLLGEEVRTITIKTALDSLTINKKSNTYYAASLIYKDAKGKTIDRVIKVKPRGRSRRNHCDFPPLKIKFSKKELKAEGIRNAHKTMKLVTHCNEEIGSKQNVLEEYLAYKIYNEISENSLKVQLIEVNYEDTDSHVSFKRYGILIEDIDELAERTKGEEVEGFGKEMTAFQEQELNHLAVFQYMIGNEDWRISFMRNVKFVQPIAGGKLIAIPYDFDASGLVHTNYSKPDRDLKLQSVRQRAFMGKFSKKGDRAAAVAHFNAKKEAIYKLVNDFKALDENSKAVALDYLDSFYEIINTPKLIKKAMPVNGRTPEPTNINGDFQEI